MSLYNIRLFVLLEKVGFGKKGKKKLLEVTIDKNLKFKEHILKQCKKAGKKPTCFRKSLLNPNLNIALYSGRFAVRRNIIK